MLGGLWGVALGEMLSVAEDVWGSIPGLVEEFRRKGLNLESRLEDDGLRAGGDGGVSGDVEFLAGVISEFCLSKDVSSGGVVVGIAGGGKPDVS
jgi:hypothetical protein